MNYNFRTRVWGLALPASLLALVFGTTHCQGKSASAGSDELFQRLDSNSNGKIESSEVTSEQRRLFERLLRKADANGDQLLSRDEFLAGLVPSRPEKQIEAKQPEGYPQADAIRYLLLKLDTRPDSWIEADEIPEPLQPTYEAMVERLDTNKNGSVDRYELARGGRELGQIAARYVAQQRVDVRKELAKFDKAQGELAQRFDKTPGPIFESLADPSKARVAYRQLDADSDGKLVLDELPEPLQRQFERFMRMADRDGNGGLSEREFLTAAERISRGMSGQRPPASNARSTSNRRSRPAKSPTGIVQAAETHDESMPAESMAADDE